MSIKSFITLLAIGLLASVGLNLWQWTRTPQAAAPETDSAPSAIAQRAKNAASSVYGPDDIIECRQKLELCERRRKLGPLTIGTFQGKRDASDSSDADPGHNADFLCDLAQAQVKQHWLDSQNEIVTLLRATLANDAIQEQDMRTAVDRYAEGLGLSDAERSRFEETYREARIDRIDSIREALEQDPPNFGSVLSEIQALHADEDRITKDMFGPEAEQWLQESEREARGSLLAIAATYADVPWEEVIE